MRLNFYGQNRHILVVDGIPQSGFKEGDHIQIKLEGNAMSRTKGGDGASANFSTAQGGQITFGLNPTSPTLNLLYQLRESQRTTPRLFSVQVVTGVEEIISASGCGFGELPQFSTGGDKMNGRDIMLECLDIKLDVSVVEPLVADAGGLI